MTDRKRLIDVIKKIKYAPYEGTIEANLVDQFSEYALQHIVDKFIENGVIAPPCKFNDTIYVIPSETNCKLNILRGFEHLNKVYEQKVCEVRIYANNKYLLCTCGGLQSAHSDLYKDTWYLSKSEALNALKKRSKL